MTLEKIKSAEATFQEVINHIDNYFDFTPTAFKNGVFKNEAGQHNGSCKVFSFAKIENLNQQETLNCFGDYYKKDVLDHPEGNNHQNIRNFIKYGWEGIAFEAEALIRK
jgi:hypothetical protein